MAASPPPRPTAPGRASPPVRPVLRADDLLAGRYRLVRPVPAAGPRQDMPDDGPAVLWLAQDEVLARAVAAKVLPAAGPRGAQAARPSVAAAAASGAVSHPGLARVYDAAVEPRPAEPSGPAEARTDEVEGEVDAAYVISEWVDGPSLLQRLTSEGPCDAVEAVELADELAEALGAAHARGLVHGRVHPGNVLLTRGGAVKLTDLGVSTVLPARAVPALRAGDPVGPAGDVRDLAAVVYALLTGRWPATATPQPSGGLPEAPSLRESGRARGRLTSPGQVRAGVPRSLDAVVVRALDHARAAEAPDLTTAAGLSAALTSAVRADTARVVPAPRGPRRIPPAVRRLLPALALLALLTALGVAGYSAGVSVGTVQDAGSTAPSPVAPSPGTAIQGPAVPVPLAGAVIRAFDPAPGDGSERPGEVANAYDDDPSTTWRTERYASERFGGLKSGVGLLIDLGKPTPLGRVELTLPGDGTVVELRLADTAAAAADGYRLVTSGVSAKGVLVLTAPAETRARYCLLWITGLPRVDGRFIAGISELRLLSP